MKRLRIEYDSAGFRQVLFSQGVRAAVDSAARGVASRAGEGFEAEPAVGGFGGGRPIAYVRAATEEARGAEARRKRLTRVLSGSL